MACLAHFYVESDLHCTFYSSLYLFTFILYQGRDFCSFLIWEADNTPTAKAVNQRLSAQRGNRETNFIFNGHFAKIDKGSSL